MGGAGVYSVAPRDEWYVWGGYYEDGSLIWHNRWVSSDLIRECREAMQFPAEPSTAVILRRMIALDGPADFDVMLDLRAGFGRSGMRDVKLADGVWTARSGRLRMRWTGAREARLTGEGRLQMRKHVEPGDCHDLVLEVSDRALPPDPPDPESAWRQTENAWDQAVPQFEDVTARRDSRHAYAVLRGMTSSGGGMVAAATLGLPERAEAGRNYDYRYAWIRDQCFAGQAASKTGAHPLLDDAVSFVSQRILADGPKLSPAYSVDGGSVPDERELKALPGYPGGKPKTGNWVNKQFQLDAFGEALLLFSEAGRHDHLDLEHWRAVEETVAAIEARWREPDAGIWELDDHHWAHSRLICVAGLRMISGLAPSAQAAAWASLADAVAADAGKDCVHPSGRWQRAPDDERVDAALLLPGIRGAYPPEDPRHLATLKAVVRELGRDGYIYRFRHDERPLEDAEGAFLLCGFIAALAANQLGKPVEARAWFERNRASCGPPGLFTEEYDVTERQLRGNVPQAFVHALFLECASVLKPSEVDSTDPDQ
jgi:GH15 family glucan-1,4-alpha-glucosidase